MVPQLDTLDSEINVPPFIIESQVLTRVTNYEFNFLSKGVLMYIRIKKIPFISNLKKLSCATKRDMLELVTLRYTLFFFSKINKLSNTFILESLRLSIISFVGQNELNIGAKINLCAGDYCTSQLYQNVNNKKIF